MIQIKSPDSVLAYAAFYFAELLGIEKLDIDVSIGYTEEEGLGGFAQDMGGDEYLVALNPTLTDPVDLFSTLAHEMVHVSQYVRGDLEDGRMGRVRWKRRFYKDAETGTRAYYRLPWEREAYKLQGPMTMRLFRDKKFHEILLTNRGEHAN